jgi:hypothetical protein
VTQTALEEAKKELRDKADELKQKASVEDQIRQAYSSFFPVANI